jgi:hypothetical protein
MQRRIDAFLDQAEGASDDGKWGEVAEKARAALAIEPDNADALTFLKMAEANGAGAASLEPDAPPPPAATLTPAPIPTSFANGRYAVKKFLGEGGKKKVYLAHDSLLDRDVAFALIKGDGLDQVGRERVTREAQAMGRLGSHPHVVTVFDLGEADGQPYMVTELMGGGDVEGLIEKADGPLPTEQAIEIAKSVCRGLEFAHAKGVVHRDLKPGNVWLTADGVAKIGDFGLAVALDRSRLTMHGMMVGTVSYMPPEQALGGEVTPQSDLYSLGAMLYEMVTGHPPFVGTDPTAVISQHINIPPVAPSWQTEHCPPALEQVILQMLEKDPAKRPASATETLAALTRVDASQKSASHSDSNVLDRLARGVFVGREKELERLRKAFDEAFAGRGSLVMLVGEPGIGKTRTTQELETYARMRGAMVLWGGAHESSGAPPYRPWVQVASMFAAQDDVTTLGALMSPDAPAELSRIIPWLRGQANVGEPEPITDPESARFRLFDAYASFLRAMVSRTPLVIVLDDLHWADKPTLQLLQHIARELSHLRVLIVGTYRDTDLSRTHPLSEVLASLNRDAGFLRVALKGLTRDEVDAYIHAAANVAPPARLVDKIFEETEGNPFFLSEVVNLMTQEGTLSNESVSDIVVPDGVKEALGRRLDRISEETNELLQVCAIAGREFAYDTLTLLGERGEDEILRLIEEAVGARVIEEMDQPGRYRFTHALMQETLLSELSTTRRVRLHGQVGEALEKRWGPLSDERAPRLAEHFVEAAMLSPRFAAKAVRYAKLAAAQAEAQTAWDDAADWYERVLALVSASDDGLGEDEAQLLVALGVCQRNSTNHRSAWRNLMRATTLFRQRGDNVAMARATVEAAVIPSTPLRLRALIDEALELLPASEPHLEAKLLLARWSAPLGGEGAAGLERVEEIVARHALPDIEAGLLQAKGLVAMEELDLGSATELLAAARDRFLALSMPIEAGFSILFVGCIPLFGGDIRSGEASAREQLAIARRFHAVFARSNIELRLAGLAMARGNWRHFDELHADMADLVGNYGQDLQAAGRAELEGDLKAAVAVLPAPELAGGFPSWVAQVHAGRARVRLLAGDEEAARAEFARFAEALASVGEAPFSLQRFFALTEMGEALAVLADDAAAQAFYTELARCAPIRWDPFVPRGADAMRGGLALRLGLVDEAEAHFTTGRDWSHDNGLDVEEARNLEGLSEVAERRNDHALAMRHLDAAGELFARQGAKFYLQRLLAKKEILKA